MNTNIIDFDLNDFKDGNPSIYWQSRHFCMLKETLIQDYCSIWAGLKPQLSVEYYLVPWQKATKPI